MRPILAFMLAKAVWHYYDSEWMNVGWNLDNICFMGEVDDDGESTYFLRPYLSTRLDKCSEKPPEYRKDIGMMHKYPRVFALGLMLVEIGMGKPIGIQGSPDNWNARIANQQLMTLRSMVNKSTFEEDCRFPRYKSAMEKCLDPKLFKNAPFNPAKPQENLEKRRSILYTEVVEPLRQLIEGTGWNTELDEIEQTPLLHKQRQPPARDQPESPLPPTLGQTPVAAHAAAPDEKYDANPSPSRRCIYNYYLCCRPETRFF